MFAVADEMRRKKREENAEADAVDDDEVRGTDCGGYWKCSWFIAARLATNLIFVAIYLSSFVCDALTDIYKGSLMKTLLGT